MPYRERETKKVYFKIAEVADMIEQATSLLRFWEQEFDFLSPKKNKMGDRQYNRKDVQIVLDLNILIKGMGMSLWGVNLAYQYGYVEEMKNLYKEKIKQETKQI